MIKNFLKLDPVTDGTIREIFRKLVEDELKEYDTSFVTVKDFQRDNSDKFSKVTSSNGEILTISKEFIPTTLTRFTGTPEPFEDYFLIPDYSFNIGFYVNVKNKKQAKKQKKDIERFTRKITKTRNYVRTQDGQTYNINISASTPTPGGGIEPKNGGYYLNHAVVMSADITLIDDNFEIVSNSNFDIYGAPGIIRLNEELPLEEQGEDLLSRLKKISIISADFSLGESNSSGQELSEESAGSITDSKAYAAEITAYFNSKNELYETLNKSLFLKDEALNKDFTFVFAPSELGVIPRYLTTNGISRRVIYGTRAILKFVLVDIKGERLRQQLEFEPEVQEATTVVLLK